MSHKVVCVITAGFDALRDELGSSRASSVHQGLSLDASYDEQDMVKVSIKMFSFLLFSNFVLGSDYFNLFLDKFECLM